MGETVRLGFNRDAPSDDKPFPDAWCDNCELIRAAHNGWNEEAQKLAKISLLCTGCYERARIRNTRTTVTLDDLADLRWKCGSCEEWHIGPCLDFTYDAPYYWLDEHKKAAASVNPSTPGKDRAKTFLDEDYCAIDDEHFFVRGIICLPIVGSAEDLRWGVWGFLSRENFETLLEMDEDPKCTELPPMYSWLSTRVPEYPETLSLKMYARIPELGLRPHFELELSDHPLRRSITKALPRSESEKS